MAKKEENSWKLIFDGNLLRPKDRDVARARFAERFSSDPKQLDRIFSGRSVVLRRDLAHGSARRIQADLRSLGIDCRLESVPTLEVVSEANTGVYSEAEIDAALQGEFRRPRCGIFYRISLLVVAALMVSLPVAYFALVAAAGYGLYWHLSGNLPYFADPLLQAIALAAYAISGVVAAVLLIFLLKPLWARHRGIEAPVVLDRLRQPTFFYLVEQITQRIGAPMPSQIRVDANVNASASLQRGVFSRELTLTVGMPLFMAMDVQTLSGILAHEFGHFAQRTGMRVRMVIEHIRRWLYRRAYEDDAWDRVVQRMAGHRNPLVRLPGYASQAGIYLTRRVLVALARAGGLFSRHMSRQMELDADRYEVSMTGSECFRDTAVKLRVLAESFRSATDQAQLIWRDNQLPDDLPVLAARHAAALPPSAVAAIEASIATRASDPMDTHPPDVERIRAAEALGQDGVLAHTGPAQRLLHRCEELCKKVTFAWYREQGYSFTSEHLVPVDIVSSQLTAQDEQAEALGRYLGESFIDHRVLPVPGIQSLLGRPGAALGAALRAWREPLGGDAIAELAARYADLFDRRSALAAAEAVSRVHVPFNPAKYGASATGTAEILDESKDVADDLENVAGEIAVQDKALGRRLAVALALGCRRGLLDREDVETSLYALRALAQVCEHTVDIVGLERRLRSLMELSTSHQDNTQIANAITDALRDYQRWIDRVNNALIRIPNPLRPNSFLGETVWQWTPDRERVADDPEAACQTLRGIVDALRFLNVRITGRLAEHAERVESTLGA